jgi:hypothetical protein
MRGQSRNAAAFLIAWRAVHASPGAPGGTPGL